MRPPRQYAVTEWIVATVIGVIGFTLFMADPERAVQVFFWGIVIFALVCLLAFVLIHPVLLLWVLGIGGLFSLFGGDDCDCDL
jgi:hypothetical protein